MFADFDPNDSLSSPRTLIEPLFSRILLLSVNFIVVLTKSQTIRYYDHYLNLLSSLVAYTNAAGTAAEHENQVVAFAIVGSISVVMVRKEDGEVYIDRW